MESMTPSDNDLATAVKHGDGRAFEELVRRHQGRVFAAAYRITGNREDALDVAQDALIKAYNRIESWQPFGGFLPWLLRLTSNQAIDFIRRRKSHKQELFNEAYVPETEHAAVEPSVNNTAVSAQAREIDDRIRAALDVLSPMQRTVFIMRHYDGLQLSEIAESLGCTDGSVKVHLFRALKKLQKELGDLYQET